MNERTGSLIAGGTAFLANAVPSAPTGGFEGWIPVIVQSGALGLLAFVLWHIFAKFIPHLLDSNQKMMTDMGRILDEQRKDFQDALKEHRQETKETMKSVVDALEGLKK